MTLVEVITSVILDRQHPCNTLMLVALYTGADEKISSYSRGKVFDLSPYVSDNTIAFNLMPHAIGVQGVQSYQTSEEDGIMFTCRMGGNIVDIAIPTEHILSLYSPDSRTVWLHRDESVGTMATHPVVQKYFTAVTNNEPPVSFSVVYDVCKHYGAVDSDRAIMVVLLNQNGDTETVRVDLSNFIEQADGRVSMFIDGKTRYPVSGDLTLHFKYTPTSTGMAIDDGCEYEVLDIFTRLDAEGKPLFTVSKQGDFLITDPDLAISMSVHVSASQPESETIADTSPSVQSEGNVVSVDFRQKKLIK